MTAPKRKPDRSGLKAALILWVISVGASFAVGLDTSETSAKHWLGHWITNIWTFIGWIPVLIFLRGEPQPPEDHQ